MKQNINIVFGKVPLPKFPNFKAEQIKFPFNGISLIERVVHHFIHKPFAG
jgi:hypothetical protein